MKKQNNRDKLNDALGMVDEELLQDAMLHVEGMGAAHLSRRAVMRRRVAIVVAACLSLVAIAGAMLAVPLLTVGEPAQTQPPLAITTEEGEPFYVEAPIVKVVQLSADETATISDSSIPTVRVEGDANVKEMKTPFSSIPVLVFDCRPGETVTVQADSDCLGVVNMSLEENADRDTRWEFFKKFRQIQHLYNPEWKREGEVYFTDMQTVNPAEGSIVVDIRRGNGETLGSVLRFTVTNEEGQITGAGSFYIGIQYQFNDEEGSLALYNPYVRRSAVLGEVRFSDPETVTEANVNELLDAFAGRVDEVRASLDFSPATTEEFNDYARADIIRSEFANQRIISTGRGKASWQDFSFCYYKAENTDKERSFILFDDGTWFEYRSHGDCNVGQCHLDCANLEEQGEHHGVTVGCTFHAIDGRVYEVQTVSPDSDNETLVLIQDPTA